MRRTPKQPPPELPAGRLLRVSEAAALLNVDERTLRAWIADGRFAVVRFSSRCLRIPLDGLLEFVAKKTVIP